MQKAGAFCKWCPPMGAWGMTTVQMTSGMPGERRSPDRMTGACVGVDCLLGCSVPDARLQGHCIMGRGKNRRLDLPRVLQECGTDDLQIPLVQDCASPVKRIEQIFGKPNCHSGFDRCIHAAAVLLRLSCSFSHQSSSASTIISGMAMFFLAAAMAMIPHQLACRLIVMVSEESFPIAAKPWIIAAS